MEGTSLILRTISKLGDRDIDNLMLTPTLLLYSQDESSEMFIGEWAEARGIRDQLFIATKVGISRQCHPQMLIVLSLLVHFQLQGS